MSRNVVGDILPSDSESIDGVVHQCGNAVVTGNGSGEDSQFLVVGTAPDQFLAPIAKNVRAEARIRFAAVVSNAPITSSRKKYLLALRFPVPFGNRDAIEQFP